MELTELKARWNEILFALEAKNRVAWLTFFDARLDNFDGQNLKLDFSDSEKFSGGHSYSDARTKFVPMLQETIMELAGINVEISW